MGSQQPAIMTLTCLALTVGILGYMFWQFWTRKHDLLSYRNFFLLGFTHFQTLSGFLSGLTGGQPWRGQPFRGSTYIIYTFGLVLFLVLFFWAYRRNRLARFVGHIFPSRSPEPSTVWIMAGIIAGLVTAVFSIAVAQMGFAFLSALTGQMVFGGLVFSIVLSTYLWVRSPANPLYTLLMIILPPAVVFLSTVGAHGRREMVGALLGIVWGIYMFKWRYDSTGKTFVKFAVIGALALSVLVAYTAVRGAYRGKWGVDEENVAAVAKIRLQSLSQGGIMSRGMMPVVFTDTANNSLFAIDRWGHDDDKPHEPFFAIKYILVNPIPRAWWPDKPIGYGKTMPLALHHRDFNHITLGPGVIGHGWHEMGILGIAFYGFFFGLLTRAMDEKLMRQVRNPFFVAAAGSLLGHALGMPRGDIGTFMVNSVGALLAPFGILLVLGVLSGGGGREAAEAELAAFQANEDWAEGDGAWGNETSDEYDDHSDPEYDESHQEDVPVA